MTPEQALKMMRSRDAFTPGAPIDNQELFAGRLAQLQKIMNSVTQRGYHIVLFGDRGVGKTSLANIMAQNLSTLGMIVARVTCDASDNFTSIWKKALNEVSYDTIKPSIGFTTMPEQQRLAMGDALPTVVSPDDVRRLLSQISSSRPVLIVLDEFDRILDQQTATLVSDTVKSLSDHGVNATMLLIGVADSVGELIAAHESVERALVQIHMPRMTSAEIESILDKGLRVLGMTINVEAQTRVVSLSQGVPYVTHLLGLHSAQAAISAASSAVTIDHVRTGMASAIDQWNQSIKQTYYTATQSHQPGNMYSWVLLACALCPVDELGYFTAASVREPLREITQRDDIDIPNFVQHLAAFSTAARGNILSREGQQRKWRYRFKSPLMRPYIVMRGHDDRLLSG